MKKNRLQTNQRVVVIGASAGGIEALTAFISELPPDIEAAIFVVVHVPQNARSVLPRILSRAGDLQAFHVFDEEPIDPGVIYVAPPDRHLILRHGSVSAVFGPRENGHRPAVDPLFRSAAEVYAGRAIGVVLSRNLDDGTAGLAAIKQCGGIAMVQSVEEANHRGMPQSAIDHVEVDFILPVRELARRIIQLVEDAPAAGEEDAVKEDLNKEVRSARLDPRLSGEEPDGEPSGYTCPECNGGLWEVVEGKLVRYRCRVGHAYTADSLLAASGSQVEAALWAALRALEENAGFAGRLASRARTMENDIAAKRFRIQSERAAHHAITLRKVLLSVPAPEFEEPINVGNSNQEI